MLTDRFDNLTFERRGEGVVLLTINRETTGRTLETATLHELARAFSVINDSAEIRAAILTGNWDSQAAPDSKLPRQRAGEQLSEVMSELGKPMIAAIDGLVSGVGTYFALKCPLRIATEWARFDFGFTGPDYALNECNGSIITEELIEMIQQLQLLDARQAAAAGLVNKVTATEAEMMAACDEIAMKICANAPLAIRYVLGAVNHGLEMAPDDAMFLETTLFSLCFATEDMKEGTRAFLEKRSPEFSGK